MFVLSDSSMQAVRRLIRNQPLAVIGVLIALLLPAVQAAREAARRMQCTNNLTQLSIATQNYEMAFRVYPPGTINKTGPITFASPASRRVFRSVRGVVGGRAPQ